jgi:hypothetical protein
MLHRRGREGTQKRAGHRPAVHIMGRRTFRVSARHSSRTASGYLERGYIQMGIEAPRSCRSQRISLSRARACGQSRQLHAWSGTRRAGAHAAVNSWTARSRAGPTRVSTGRRRRPLRAVTGQAGPGASRARDALVPPLESATARPLSTTGLVPAAGRSVGPPTARPAGPTAGRSGATGVAKAPPSQSRQPRAPQRVRAGGRFPPAARTGDPKQASPAAAAASPLAAAFDGAAAHDPPPL